MKRIISLCCTVMVAAVFAISSQQLYAADQYAAGVVFCDANKNGIQDLGEKGIKGVRVSNGISSIKTDENGKYRIQVSDDSIIFVIKPRNWMTGFDKNYIPKFYYIHKPNGSPKLKFRGVDPTGPLPVSIDFPLYPHSEPNKFKAVFMGDTQVNSIEDINYLAHDIIEELVGTDAKFCISLGDIVNNNLSLYEPLVPVMGKLCIPTYYVKGNHDTNYDAAPNQKLIDETYERYFGPSHYSFDYGPVHFISINNSYFVQAKGYGAKLDDEQMAFLKDDLVSIPRKQLVVLMMHIPITQMVDAPEIFELLKSHPNVFAIAAHWHTQRNIFVNSESGWKGSRPLHLLVNNTSCGSWWNGAMDEVGIPHTTMSDGAPNGYSIITFNGSKYSIKFKAARKPENYQMNIYAPDSIKTYEAAGTQVLVNVFAGSEKSKVEMRIGDKGDWIPMEFFSVEDPAYVQTKKREDSEKQKSASSLPNPGKCPHMWKANLPADIEAGTYLINIRTTDMYKQTYTACRVINVK